MSKRELKAKEKEDNKLTKELITSGVMNIDDKFELIDMMGNEVIGSSGHEISKLNEVMLFCEDNDDIVVKRVLTTLTNIFCEILPGYKIRTTFTDNKKVQLSKEVKQLREYEAGMLKAY